MNADETRFLPNAAMVRASMRFALELIEVFGCRKDIGEFLCSDNLTPALSYQLARLNEIDHVISVTPTEQPPKIGE
jgi:hypothetical protein